ncbi:hypothetical protein CDAR_526911 [Caerostris darwini]|uniref:Uncharacterized protein n=1 Tax=Caerostris darwini TaxID=1538125 RepID=A0AAV4Q6U0_9ARAC|nr:hypothetical protein CDAR_526911 [Caerostris darwini]
MNAEQRKRPRRRFGVRLNLGFWLRSSRKSWPPNRQAVRVRQQWAGLIAHDGEPACPSGPAPDMSPGLPANRSGNDGFRPQRGLAGRIFNIPPCQDGLASGGNRPPSVHHFPQMTPNAYETLFLMKFFCRCWRFRPGMRKFGRRNSGKSQTFEDFSLVLQGGQKFSHNPKSYTVMDISSHKTASRLETLVRMIVCSMALE